MNKYLELLRIRQWYKNLVIFLPLIFIGSLFDLKMLLLSTIGFFMLCLVSSASYIFNDIKDIKEDKKNPEKKSRPIASGAVSIKVASLIALVLLFGALFVSSFLSWKFAFAAFSLFAITLVYTLWIKHKLFIDILAISINFVLRTVSGTFLISATISPWLVLCTFFLSLFLSAGKRASELDFLKGNAATHRKVLVGYTPQITGMLLTISTVCLIMSYSLYSLNVHPRLILTLPLTLYIIFRYLYFVHSGSEIPQHLDRLVKDRGMVLASSALCLLVILFLYL